MTREHVISRAEDKQAFLNAHPLHYLYGGENAFTIDEYTSAILGAGLSELQKLGPQSTPINYFPASSHEVHRQMEERFSGRFGRSTARFVTSIPILRAWLASRWDKTNHGAGRLYSFLARRTKQARHSGYER